MKKLLYLTVFAVICSFGAVSAQQFPNVQVENQKGDVIETGSLIDGQTPLIVSFWSTTCKPCIKELDTIAEQMEDWKDEVNFRVVPVSIDDSRSMSRAKALAAGRGWTSVMSPVYDKNQDFKRALNVINTPQVFVFDKNGKMVYSHTGYIPGNELELLKVIKGLK